MSFKNTMIVVAVILIFLIIEMLYDNKKHNELYQPKDTRNNFKIGIMVVVINSFTKLMFYASMYYIHKYRILTLENSIWIWILGILASDLSYYIYHRMCHGVNWFWVSHVVHHSSEHLNLSTSFRLSVTNNISGHFIFWLWMPLLGFDPSLCIISHFIVHAYQSWLHTEIIHKLPAPIEYIFNTPSHHRVHHSSNPEYLDKNHGGILILWDRVFKTYCDEIEKPVYGLTNHPKLDNAHDILFKDCYRLIRKCKESKGFRSGIKLLFSKPDKEVYG